MHLLWQRLLRQQLVMAVQMTGACCQLVRLCTWQSSFGMPYYLNRCTHTLSGVCFCKALSFGLCFPFSPVDSCLYAYAWHHARAMSNG
jgi:hypothetical protein